MSSSSSDSEDKNSGLVRQVVNADLITDAMFEKGNQLSIVTPWKYLTLFFSASKKSSHENTSPEEESPKPLQSQRYIEYDDVEADLEASKAIQDLIYKKISKRIDESVEFVEVPTKKQKKKHKNTETFGMRLLKDTDVIEAIDYSPEVVSSEASMPKIKPAIKRREIESDGISESEKLKIASIDGEAILQQTETKHWKQKKARAHKVFHYREKNSVLYEKEPENEFSKLRRKNNWTESKIAGYYKKFVKKTT